jgi:hypothetical protein
MTHDDDFIAQLEDYLEAFDGSTPLPDHVRDAIRAELPSARQVRPRTGLLRIFTMFSNVSTGARLGAAVATVVVAVVLGAAFLNRNGSNVGVGGATPSLTRTAAPSVAATPVATALPSDSGAPLTLKLAPIAACDPTDTQPQTCVAAGTYQLNNFPGPNAPIRVTVDVPAGWFDWDAAAGVDAVLVDGGARDRGSTGWGVLFSTVGDVSRDPCDSTKGLLPVAQGRDGPQQLAAAMAAWPKFSATTPQPITVDGHSGLKFQLTSTAPAACSNTGVLWRSTTGGTVDPYPMVDVPSRRAPGTFEIVDTGHGLLVIRMTDFPQASPAELGAGITGATLHLADQVELHAIVSSIRLTPPPG